MKKFAPWVVGVVIASMVVIIKIKIENQLINTSLMFFAFSGVVILVAFIGFLAWKAVGND